MTETHTRTFARMLSYRFTAWLLTVLVMYWLTGNWQESIGGSLLINFVLAIDYYIHERLWLKVKWGQR